MRGQERYRSDRRPPPWEHRLFAVALACGLLLPLAACSVSSSEIPTPRTAPPTESTARCFGYTARLTLVAGGESTTPATPSAVASETQWQLTVAGPPGLAIEAQVTASLDTFTIRGEQANRLDLALARWSGSAQVLTAQGVVLLPELEGEIREGDQGRILAFIRTPGGSFGLDGLIFQLRPEGDGVAILSPVPLAQEPCPATATATPT